jgi:hypothetical protein
VTWRAVILRVVSKRYDEDCMKLPATNKNVLLHNAKSTNLPSQSPQAGWDPFEVWRTRVLLPRLGKPTEEAAAVPPAPPRLVRS